MGRLSREAGGLGEYSENANENQEQEPELEPDDGWPDTSQLETNLEPEPDEDEPA